MSDDDGWQDELRQVRLALDKLGAKEPRKGRSVALIAIVREVS